MLDKIRELQPNKEDEVNLRLALGITLSPPPQDLEYNKSSLRYKSKLARLQSHSTLPPPKKTGLGLVSLLNKMTHPNPDPKIFPTRSNSHYSTPKQSPRLKPSNSENFLHAPKNIGQLVRPKPAKLPQMTPNSSVIFQNASYTEHLILGGGNLTGGKYFMSNKSPPKGKTEKNEDSFLSRPELSCFNNQSMTLDQSAVRPRQGTQGGGLKVLKKNVTKKKIQALTERVQNVSQLKGDWDGAEWEKNLKVMREINSFNIGFKKFKKVNIKKLERQWDSIGILEEKNKKFEAIQDVETYQQT